MERTRETYILTEPGNFGKRALAVGIIGLIVSAVGLFLDRSHFFHSYLTAFTFWLTIGLGGLFFTMLHHLVGATWSVVMRRISENTMSLALAAAVFFVVVLAGMGELYHWSHHDVVAGDTLLQEKAPYLNVAFFVLRALIYIGVWVFLIRTLYRASLAQDRGHTEEGLARMRRVSAPGMVFFALTLTFAAIDWLMSQNPHWYSTAFGVYIFSGSVMAVLAFMTLVAILLRERGALTNVITEEHYHDLGKLLFTFVIFWGYIAFAQYFLIWYANIPEETAWYHARWGGIWQLATLLLVFGHFVIPFVVLISRGAKRNLKVLKLTVIWILFMHWVDLYWVIVPNHPEGALGLIWVDLAAMAGVGGFSLWFFWRRLSSQPLVPVGDPRLEASIHFANE